jgi:DegV family protein with EDD domain
MQKPAFVTDSTSYLPEEVREKYDIQVAPQVVIFGEETLYDGLDIMPTQFYERLKIAETMPTTSQVEIPSFKQIYGTLVQQERPIISILISDKLSGTIQSAEEAKKEFPEARIEIIDSESAAMAMGFQVLAAARAVQDGRSLDEVLEVARNAKQQTGVVFMVDTLEFLHRGGRIGGAARLLGTAVKLKPILELQDGIIETVAKVRTRSKALTRLLDLLEERIDGRANVRLAVLHAAAEAEAKEVLEMAAERVNPIEQIFSELSPAVGVHVGPGTLGLCYSVEL